jgi:hypothetical protein
MASQGVSLGPESAVARGHEERGALEVQVGSLVYGWMYASPQQVAMLSADRRHHGMACRAYSLASGAALTCNTTYGMTNGFQPWVANRDH